MGHGAEPSGPTQPIDRGTRLIRVFLRLLSGAAPGPADLAVEVGVRPPTLRKDLAHLRRATGWPLRWRPSDARWHLGGDALPLHLPPSTGLVLEALTRSLAQHGHGPLRGAAERIAQAVHVALDESLRRTCDRLATTTDPAVIEALTAAIAERRRVVIRYASRSRGGAIRRQIFDPERFELSGQHLYVVGARLDRRERLPHRVDRITAVEPMPIRLLGQVHVADVMGSPENRVGIYGGVTVTEARCRVPRTMADLIESEPACRDYTVVHGADTSVFTFRVSHVGAFVRWAMRWMDALTILSPPEAVVEVRRTLAGALARHRQEVAGAVKHVEPTGVEER